MSGLGISYTSGVRKCSQRSCSCCEKSCREARHAGAGAPAGVYPPERRSSVLRSESRKAWEPAGTPPSPPGTETQNLHGAQRASGSRRIQGHVALRPPLQGVVQAVLSSPRALAPPTRIPVTRGAGCASIGRGSRAHVQRTDAGLRIF